MVRLVGQEVTGACKAKAQSGALFKSRECGCAFLFERNGNCEGQQEE